MCIHKDKWPSKDEHVIVPKYEEAIKNINTIEKLNDFLFLRFKREEDTKDYWQYPWQTFDRGTYDCEDMAIMILDIMTRILKLEAYFIIYRGDYWKIERTQLCDFTVNKTLKRRRSSHAVVIFNSNEYVNKGVWMEYSNKTLTPLDLGRNFIDWGKTHYPIGIKYYEKRDNTGKIIEKKRKWIGYL